MWGFGLARAYLQARSSCCQKTAQNPTGPPWHLTVLHGPVSNTAETAYASWCGHNAVGPSIWRGLEALNVSYDIQPTHSDRIRDVVYVHVGHDAVRQATRWKAQEKIKLVVVGPNVAGAYGQGICGDNPMLKDPNLDLFLIPSQSAALLAIWDCPWLRPKIRIVANGVNANFWDPAMVVLTVLYVPQQSAPMQRSWACRTVWLLPCHTYHGTGVCCLASLTELAGQAT